MPKQPKVEHNIDLQCTLCPKNPKFSDVSHLLTHISSKGHLAHRFKLQIRAQGESEAKEVLDNFDFWYRTSDLDTLLSERLAAKDQKKAKKSRASNASTTSTTSIKQEKEVAPAPASAPEAPMFRAPVPGMHLLPAPPRANRTPSMAAEDWESSVYSTPTARRRIPNFTRAETPIGDKVDPNLATPWKPDPEDEDDESDKKSGEKLTDSAKLKGVLWPGMDLFDSATPDMKRLRNQKKDNTVIQGMIATSRAVEPAEISYHANGEFRASRYIFGPLSNENSPTRSVSPKKRRAARKVAPALNDLSVNAPRLRASRGRKAAAGESPQKSGASSLAQGPPVFLQPAPALNPLAMGLNNRRFHPSTEEEEEFRLTVGGLGLQQDERKKRTFTIFQEAPQISPGRTETPLEDHGYALNHGPQSFTTNYSRFDFPNHGLPNYGGPSMTSGPFQVSPTPASKPASYGFGKENGQIDMQHHHQARRTLSESHVYPPQVFYDTSYNPLYNHAYARSYAYSTQFTFSENKSPSGFNPNFFGAPSTYKLQASHMSQVPQSQGPTMGSGNSATQSNDAFGM
ncbi:uncharacterized protein LY89DRAFT_693957 [Mollisia scopiformis]|uniref:Uncharacterized protein n=1 Tax=Mollisia scopiformis TaxID=149040 RepID=A0A194XR43_MOLSC|nr:uncharacterized protein LY89DRAFT_693957 [Mollisia scopiformis]KUJ22658.1 hypothetical protein LY89DRAFT_693957 [Mollisia scopiformis]